MKTIQVGNLTIDGSRLFLKHLLVRQIVLLIILFVVRGWRKVFEF